MLRFTVRLHGTGCWFATVDEHSGETHPERPMGFYTVRFVEAASPHEAVAKAIEAVRDRVTSMYRGDYPRTIEVESVAEDPDQFVERAPGTGFVWYSEDEEETESH